MATIRKEFHSPRPPAEVWDALRDFPSVHERLAKGFVTATRMEAAGVRIVTFANGAQAREWLVTSDDAQRRLVYAIKDLPGYTHYSAAAQVFEDADRGGSRFVWTVDFLPDSMAKQQDGLMDLGAEAMRRTLA
jgi:hypothetical protein